MSSSSSSEPPRDMDELVGLLKHIAASVRAIALRHGDQPTCDTWPERAASPASPASLKPEEIATLRKLLNG